MGEQGLQYSRGAASYEYDYLRSALRKHRAHHRASGRYPRRRFVPYSLLLLSFFPFFLASLFLFS